MYSILGFKPRFEAEPSQSRPKPAAHRRLGFPVLVSASKPSKAEPSQP
jgi:hypothetical protein